MVKLMVKMRAKIVFVFLVLTWVAACVKNPVTGDRQLALISESQEISYGREADPEVKAQFGVFEDRQAQRYIDRVGRNSPRYHTVRN